MLQRSFVRRIPAQIITTSVLFILPSVLSAPFVESHFLRQKDDEMSLSWWTDLDESSLMKFNSPKNTLESISKTWQQNEPDALKKVFLKNTTFTCNDGSRAGYYIRKYGGSKIWLIYLEGGWYCYDSHSCESRWMHTPSFMSSTSWQDHHVASGIMSANPDENPLFWKANIVYLPYCSSDVWTGTSISSRGQPYAFMGALILQEILRALLPKGLMKARKILLAGSSAGGTGVLMNIDAVSSLLRRSGSNAKVRGLVDSGWFLEAKPQSDSECLDPQRCSPTESLKKGIKLWNSDITSRCRKTYPDQPWKCFIGSKLNPALVTPVFVFQWLYDEVQLMGSNVFVPRTRAQGSFAQSLRQDMVKSLQNVSAVFAPSCVGHMVLTEKFWWQYEINHVNFGEALRCWWEEEDEPKRNPQKKAVSANLLPPDDAMMLSDQPDHVSCDEQKRKCRKRRKRQRKTQDSSNRGSRKKCRCRRRRGIQRSPYTTQASLGFLAPLDRRNQADNANERYQQPPVQSSCLHYLIDHCSLPSCSKKCPKNYDSFSGHPIKFEQMLRNAGVKGHDPIRQIFS